MDKEQALHSFWKRLNIPAFAEGSVPDDTPKPYVTYQKISGRLEDALFPTATIWTRSESWAQADSLKNQLEDLFVTGGVIIKINKGRAYIAQGTPFAQQITSEADNLIKGYQINLAVEVLTAS